MFKKLNITIFGLFLVAGASQAGVLNEGLLRNWREDLTTRDVSGSNIIKALGRAAENISSETDAKDGNFIKDFVMRSADGLDGAITNLTALSKRDGDALTTAVNNFFAKSNAVFALSSIKSYQKKWIDKIKAISAKK